MNDMKEKAVGVVKTFLMRKDYEVVDEAWQGPEVARRYQRRTSPTPRSASTMWR